MGYHSSSVVPSLLVLLILKTCVVARAPHESNSHRVGSRGRLARERPRDVGGPTDNSQCSIYHNEAFHAVVDRVCDMCHDMYRHVDPNLRAKCRSNCFKNELFTTCLAIFNPAMEIAPLFKRTVRLNG